VNEIDAGEKKAAAGSPQSFLVWALPKSSVHADPPSSAKAQIGSA
jgi:hypothetical protein